MTAHLLAAVSSKEASARASHRTTSFDYQHQWLFSGNVSNWIALLLLKTFTLMILSVLSYRWIMLYVVWFIIDEGNYMFYNCEWSYCIRYHAATTSARASRGRKGYVFKGFELVLVKQCRREGLEDSVLRTRLLAHSYWIRNVPF